MVKVKRVDAASLSAFSAPLCSQAMVSAIASPNPNPDFSPREASAFQLSLYETEEQVHDEVSSADASGFFISADGLAVTNYHSIEDSIKATATLLNGETYEVERVLYYDTGIDIAVIKVSRTNQSRRTTSAFNYLDLVGTADIRPGWGWPSAPASSAPPLMSWTVMPCPALSTPPTFPGAAAAAR